MNNEKHKPTIERLRELGKLHATSSMVVAGGKDFAGWRVAMTIGGAPGVQPDALALLIADLLNKTINQEDRHV